MAGDRRLLDGDVVAALREFNAGRDPERLALKYRKMRQNAFAFMRGACHLFYQRLPDAEVLREAPLAWTCGDLHLENFGSFIGEAGGSCFDINDFDESALAPCTWDLLRLLASLLVGADTALNIARPEAEHLCRVLLEAYVAAVAEGDSRRIERRKAEGMLRELLDRPCEDDKFLKARTEQHGKKRSLRLDGKKALPVNAAEREHVERLMASFAARQAKPEFFRVVDVARRIAGTGSLGVERFVVLVEGKGSPEDNAFIDLKHARASSLLTRLETRQPEWENEAQRVVAIQRRMQAEAPTLLEALEFENRPYVLRALQPSEDRLDLDQWREFNRLEAVIRNLARVLAWDQLRSADLQGSATIAALADFAGREAWQKPLLQLARQCADRTEADWSLFAAEFDRGAFSMPVADR